MTKQSKIQTSNSTLTFKQNILDEYFRLKKVLIPLKGKIPVIQHWQEKTFDSTKTYDYLLKQNYGVVLEEDDLVIDYDPRNDNTENKQAFQNLIDYIGIAFDTFTVQSGSGGYHVYLKKPKTFFIKEKLDDRPEFSGIEFKTVGRQMVGAGSIHPDTQKPYVPIWGSPSDTMNAPQKLLDLIKKEKFVPGVDIISDGLGSYSDDDQTISRFVEYLSSQPPAVEGCGGDLRTFQMACRGRDFNLSPAKTFDILNKYYNPRCVPIWDEDALWTKVKSAYKNNKDIQGKWAAGVYFDVDADLPDSLKKAPIFERDKTGKPKKTLRNVISYMLLPGNPLEDKLRYNQFTRNIEFADLAPWHLNGATSWSDEDAIQFKAWLSENQNYEIGLNTIHEAAYIIASRNSYHPVIDYLLSLKWDGVPRVKKWLSLYCGAPDNTYTSAVGAKTLVAAVSRIFQPGIKFDYILVLEGKQGVGKSTLAAILGKNWFGDISIDPSNKDTVDALHGKWIIEISEMECAKKSETNALKRFISCTTDRVRPAYAKMTQDFPRQCIFIGTINPEAGRGYLKDTTGNRRFWPVSVKDIKINELKKDIDQLWAEAVCIYQKGTEPLYMQTRELNTLALREADKRYDTDPIEEMLSEYIERNNVQILTMENIMYDVLIMSMSKLDKLLRARIFNALNRLDFEAVTRRIDGVTRRCFAKKTTTETEEMDI